MRYLFLPTNSQIDYARRVDTLAILFACKVKMAACTTTTIASNTNNGTSINTLAFPNYD